MKKLSVVIPVYNAGKYLYKCINSILNQTYRELEILLVDDGSTDESAAICDEYQKKDPRVKVFHIENGGVSRARNFGILNATGEWLTFVDCDDYVDLDMYEKMIKIAKQTGADITACGLFMNDVPMNLKHKEQIMYLKEHAMLECITDEYGSTMCGSVCNKMFKRSFVDESVRFVPELQMAEDMLFTIQCMKMAEKIVHCPFCGYHYVFREDSMVHSFREAKCSSVQAHQLMVAQVKNDFPQLVEPIQIRSYKQAYHILGEAITSKANLNEKSVAELKKYLSDNWSLRKKIDFSLKQKLILWCSVKLPKGANILQKIY